MAAGPASSALRALAERLVEGQRSPHIPRESLRQDEDELTETLRYVVDATDRLTQGRPCVDGRRVASRTLPAGERTASGRRSAGAAHRRRNPAAICAESSGQRGSFRARFWMGAAKKIMARLRNRSEVPAVP